MKILIVLTSHDTLGATGRKTGFWLEEFAAPYYAFLDASAELTLARQGGQPPLDPKSDDPGGPDRGHPSFPWRCPGPAPARGHAAAGRGAGGRS